MSDPARPFYLPGARAFGSLTHRARAALDAWAGEWLACGRAESTCVVNARAANEGSRAHASENYEVLHAAGGRMWFSCEAADRVSFARAIVGADLVCTTGEPADEWVAAAVRRAWIARNRAIYTALFGMAPVDETSVEPVNDALFAPGSGAVCLSCDSLALRAFVDAGIWRTLPPRDAPVSRLPELVALDRAIRSATVRLEAALGSVEIELPRLLDLHRGDVLRLPQRLDNPIAMLCEGQPFARAMLGDVQGRKGVRIIAIDRGKR